MNSVGLKKKGKGERESDGIVHIMVTYDTCFLSTLYGHRTERERENWDSDR